MNDVDPVPGRQRFLNGLPARLAAVETGVLLAGKQPAEAEIKAAILAAHSLAGSAALFGRFRLGELAREIEELLNTVSRAGLNPPAQALTDLTERWAAMKALAGLSDSEEDDSAAAGGHGELGPRLPDQDNRQVLLLEDDVELAEEIRRQLAGFNWNVDIATNKLEALALLRGRCYLALIADVVLPEGNLAGTELAEALPVGVSLPPTVFVSRRWDWEARLAGVRADAVSYLTKPVDTARLAELIAGIHDHDDGATRGRVVLVDDDELLASHYSVVLQKAGHEVIALQDPGKLLDVLPVFHPDLLILDLHMPGCNGIEVAKVVRQDSDYSGLPILFLSADRNQRPEREAIRAGADDFLLKPISEEWLVAAVEARVKRSKAIQRLSQRDSMTGLLNHLAILRELEQEASASSRNQSPLSFVMLDIDHFKQVNDCYGHPVGDRVIRALANLMRRRVRRTDLVGRYGGEEFALVLRDTTADKAEELMEGIRQRFAAIQFSAGDKVFHSSISIGVCQVRPGEGVDSIVKRADDLLYTAKNQGRNRIVTSA